MGLAEGKPKPLCLGMSPDLATLRWSWIVERFPDRSHLLPRLPSIRTAAAGRVDSQPTRPNQREGLASCDVDFLDILSGN
jgi:hypothetical protein